MQKRKLKWANIIGIMVFAAALVLNIQSNLDGRITLIQSGIAETGGTESDGSDGSTAPCPEGTNCNHLTDTDECTATLRSCMGIYCWDTEVAGEKIECHYSQDQTCTPAGCRPIGDTAGS